MSLFDGFWGLVLLAGVIYFMTGAWARLDKTHPRLSMALNTAPGLAVAASIVGLIARLVRT